MQHPEFPTSSQRSAVIGSLFACLMWVCAISCSKSDSETQSQTPKPTSTAGGTRDISGLAAQEELPTLIPGIDVPKEAWLDENIDRRDPAADGWESEVLHSQAKHALGELLEALLLAGTSELHLSSSFEGPLALVPNSAGAERKALGDHENHTLKFTAEDLSIAELQPQAANAKQLRQAALTLLGLFDGTAETEAHKIISVEQLDGNGEQLNRALFRTHALVQLSGSNQRGERCQLNTAWQLDWSGETSDDGTEQPLQLVRLEVSEYAEARLGSQPLEDVTEAVFGPLDCYEQQLLRGIDELYGHMDRQFGQSFLGMQGLAIGDINGDGLEDLYLCQQGGLPNLMLQRQPDGSLEDVSRKSATAFLDNTRSALLLDFDNDGDNDLALTIGSSILLCENRGDGTFPRKRQRSLSADTPESFYSLSAADPDGDGDLDLYAVRYVQGGVTEGVPTPYYDAKNGASNFFWRNDGKVDGELVWTDATEAVGLAKNNSRFSLSSVWEDFDSDGDPDLYVTNDFGRNNLFLNEDGHFRDVADERGAADQASGMGVSVADMDLDGDMDMYVSNMFSSAGLRIASQTDLYQDGQNTDLHRHYLFHARGNTLLANDGTGSFQDVTETAGVALGRWAWGARFFDLNNDGWQDVYVPNGFVTNRKDPSDL